MAYIVMAYIVMAFIVMVYIVMGRPVKQGLVIQWHRYGYRCDGPVDIWQALY